MQRPDLERELTDLKQQFRRHHFYLVASLAVLGVVVLLSLGLFAFMGLRLGDELWELRQSIQTAEEEEALRYKALTHDLNRQQHELAAIRKAANEDLAAIQEANRKIAAIRDPQKQLAALREANEALWSELARQREALLEQMNKEPPPPPVPTGRFKLGTTEWSRVVDEVRGFEPGGTIVKQASTESAPAYFLFEVEPEAPRVGDDFSLAIRLVNRSHRQMGLKSLRLDWNLGGSRTGGNVSLKLTSVPAREEAVVYRVRGIWTPEHDRSGSSLGGVLTLEDGTELRNHLTW